MFLKSICEINKLQSNAINNCSLFLVKEFFLVFLFLWIVCLPQISKIYKHWITVGCVYSVLLVFGLRKELERGGHSGFNPTRNKIERRAKCQTFLGQQKCHVKISGREKRQNYRKNSNNMITAFKNRISNMRKSGAENAFYFSESFDLQPTVVRWTLIQCCIVDQHDLQSHLIFVASRSDKFPVVWVTK